VWAITPSGRDAWKLTDSSIPSEYRRLLWMIDMQGDARGIHELLRHHPEQLLRDWLRELEQLGFLKLVQRTSEADRTLPLHLSELAKAAAAKAAQALDASGAYLAENRPRRGKADAPREGTVVLIVEDDPDQLALADLRVSMAGYQVRTAQGVQQLTRSLLEHGAPDVLLLDVMLPDGDGFDVLAKLRRHPDFATLPIVLLTAKKAPQDIARGLELGADGYVTKPYSKNILAGVMAGVLE
jgi:two-component system OmpR family response regulator